MSLIYGKKRLGSGLISAVTENCNRRVYFCLLRGLLVLPRIMICSAMSNVHLDPGLAGWGSGPQPFFQALDVSHDRVIVSLEKGTQWCFSRYDPEKEVQEIQGSSARVRFQHVLLVYL